MRINLFKVSGYFNIGQQEGEGTWKDGRAKRSVYGNKQGGLSVFERELKEIFVRFSRGLDYDNVEGLFRFLQNSEADYDDYQEVVAYLLVKDNGNSMILQMAFDECEVHIKVLKGLLEKLQTGDIDEAADRYFNNRGFNIGNALLEQKFRKVIGGYEAIKQNRKALLKDVIAVLSDVDVISIRRVVKANINPEYLAKILLDEQMELPLNISELRLMKEYFNGRYFNFLLPLLIREDIPKELINRLCTEFLWDELQKKKKEYDEVIPKVSNLLGAINEIKQRSLVKI